MRSGVTLQYVAPLYFSISRLNSSFSLSIHRETPTFVRIFTIANIKNGPKDMKYILGAVIAILCSFTCTDTLYGKSLATDVDDILIINTYTEANPWSNDFITSIVNMASQNSHIGVYTAHMKC